MSKVGQGQSREGANLAVYCDRISVLDEIVFERTGEVDMDVVQLPVPFVLFYNSSQRHAIRKKRPPI